MDYVECDGRNLRENALACENEVDEDSTTNPREVDPSLLRDDLERLLKGRYVIRRGEERLALRDKRT